jgi:tetratricopeptide (TPR) repeat protein
MDKILNKIIKQVIVEATTVKRLINQVNSDTILNKLIKQVITEAAQKVVISKLDNKVIALTSKYGFGFKISANYPISLDQVRSKIQGNSQVGTSSPYNSYLNYTYFVGSNMHKNPDKKYVANVIIVNAKTMLTFNSAKFNTAVKNLLGLNTEKPDAVVDGYATNTVGRKDADLEAQHHKARGTAEAVYDSSDKRTGINQGSNIIFIDKAPGYANLPDDLMTVLTKKGAALMSTSGSEVPGFMSADDDVALGDSTKTDDKKVDQDPTASKAAFDSGFAKYNLEDYKGAIVDFTKAIELAPTNDKAYFMRGATKSSLENHNGAIEDYDKAIKLNPRSLYYRTRGNSKDDLKDYNGAIEDYTEAIKLNPDDRDSYRMRGDSKNLLEPGTGDEDIRTYSAEAGDVESQDNVGSIKKQTFTFNMKDNADLKQFQDELKSKLKADPNNDKLTPNMKAFIATDKMTGYYGPLTSRLIVDLKIIFNYTNKDGKILEPDFQQTLIDKMQSKIKLTEQFNFTDDQLKLITNASVLLDPVQDDTKKDDIKKDATKKDDIKTGDTEKVALTKAYQLCLDAAKDLRKITTTNPHDYWKQYLRWNGLSFRPNANENGIAWFKSAWNKAWGTKLAAAAKIRNTATQKNIKEINRRKDDVIDMIRKGGSMTVYLRIQNPFNGTLTKFKIIWDYFTVPQNAAVKGNPKPAAKKSSSSGAYLSNPGYGGNLGH